MAEPGRITSGGLQRTKSINSLNDQYIRVIARIENEANKAALAGDEKRERQLDALRKNLSETRRSYAMNMLSSPAVRKAAKGLSQRDLETFIGPWGGVMDVQVPVRQYRRNNRR